MVQGSFCWSSWPARKHKHISGSPEDQQSEFGDGFGARFVGLQGLPEIIGRFLAGPEDQQSEFGDGFGARVVGLQGRPGRKTNKASLMANMLIVRCPVSAWSHYLQPAVTANLVSAGKTRRHKP